MASERTQFLRLLNDHFIGDEFAELCFRIKVKVDNLAGNTLPAKMVSLLLHCERHSMVKELYHACQQMRKNVTWPLLIAAPSKDVEEISELDLAQKSTIVVLGDRIDTLTARTNDGDPTLWRSVAAKNKLKDPRTLQPGDILTPETSLGLGWSFPLQISAQGSLEISDEKKGLNESIAVILMTAPGERLMHPDYGCRLNELCFMPNNKETLALTHTYIKEALEKWETRIKLHHVGAVYSQNWPYAILITIQYEIKATNEQEKAQFVFHLMWNRGATNQNNIKVWDGSSDNIF